MTRVLSYFDPCTPPNPHVNQRFGQLSACKKFLTVVASAFAALATFYIGGLGGLATYRKLVDKWKPVELIPEKTPQKVDEIAKPLIAPKKEDTDIALNPVNATDRKPIDLYLDKKEEKPDPKTVEPPIGQDKKADAPATLPAKNEEIEELAPNVSPILEEKNTDKVKLPSDKEIKIEEQKADSTTKPVITKIETAPPKSLSDRIEGFVQDPVFNDDDDFQAIGRATIHLRLLMILNTEPFKRPLWCMRINRSQTRNPSVKEFALLFLNSLFVEKLYEHQLISEFQKNELMKDVLLQNLAISFIATINISNFFKDAYLQTVWKIVGRLPDLSEDKDPFRDVGRQLEHRKAYQFFTSPEILEQLCQKSIITEGEKTKLLSLRKD